MHMKYYINLYFTHFEKTNRVDKLTQNIAHTQTL